MLEASCDCESCSSSTWQSESSSKTKAAVPPATYCCKICHVPGHWIRACPKYIQRKTVATPLASFVHTTALTPKRWRCEPCDKDFQLESQHLAHVKQHVVCPVAACGFSASKRIVVDHCMRGHVKTEHVSCNANDHSSAPSAVSDDSDSAADASDDQVDEPATRPSTLSYEATWDVLSRLISDHISGRDRLDAESAPPTPAPLDGKQLALFQQLQTSKTPPVSAPDTPEATRPYDGYCCKICGIPGHWISECPKPPVAYCCKICGIPGHWIDECLYPSKKSAPPSTYCCKICGVPGHWIYDCARAIKPRERSDRSPLELRSQRPVLAPSPLPQVSAPVQVPQAPPPVCAPVVPAPTSLAWQCKVCDIGFASDVQLLAHLEQHIVRPKRESAISFEHDSILLAALSPQSSSDRLKINESMAATSPTTVCSLPCDAPLSAAPLHRPFRMQEVVINGQRCMVFAEVLHGHG